MALGLLLVAALLLPGLPGVVSPAVLPAFAPTEGDEGVTVPILMYHGVLNDSSRWNAYVIPAGGRVHHHWFRSPACLPR